MIVRKFTVNKMYLNEYQRLLQVQNSTEENLEKNTTDIFGACAIFCEENSCVDSGTIFGALATKTAGEKIGDCFMDDSWHSFHHFHSC